MAIRGRAHEETERRGQKRARDVLCLSYERRSIVPLEVPLYAKLPSYGIGIIRFD